MAVYRVARWMRRKPFAQTEGYSDRNRPVQV